MFDLAIESRHLLVACQDASVRVYGLTNGRHVRSLRTRAGGTKSTSSAEDGSFIKVTLDESGAFVAAACTTKCVYLFEFASGSLLFTVVNKNKNLGRILYYLLFSINFMITIGLDRFSDGT